MCFRLLKLDAVWVRVSVNDHLSAYASTSSCLHYPIPTPTAQPPSLPLYSPETESLHSYCRDPSNSARYKTYTPLFNLSFPSRPHQLMMNILRQYDKQTSTKPSIEIVDVTVASLVGVDVRNVCVVADSIASELRSSRMHCI